MNGMESVRDLLDGSQRESPVGSIDRFQPGMRDPARYAPPPADHEEPSP